MTGAEVLVAALESQGVDQIFGRWDGAGLALITRLRECSIQVALNVKEEAMTRLAARYVRHTGKPDLCITTLSEGALSVAKGAGHAILDYTPMVLMTRRREPPVTTDEGCDMEDIVFVMKVVMKLSRSIEDRQLIGPRVREAFHAAQSVPCGPVHLDLPEALALQERPSRCTGTDSRVQLRSRVTVSLRFIGSVG